MSTRSPDEKTRVAADVPGVSARLVSVVALDGREDSGLLALAASVASGLEGRLAAAILESARERGIPAPELDGVDASATAGVVGPVAGRTVVLGNAALFADLSLGVESLGDWPQRLRDRGERVLFVAIDGRVAGLLGLAEVGPREHGPFIVKEEEMRAAKTKSEQFPIQAGDDLPNARATELVELANGAELDLRIAPVRKRVGDAVVRMLAYNGSIPGPTLRVEQGSEVRIHVANDGDLDATVHWHGLRLENRYDGTTETQPPIPIGGAFTYRLVFPDPGVYWYHPHIREDYGQEMGLYGTIVVVPSEPGYWPPVNRELTLTLDDLLLEDGRIAPFDRARPTFSAMGRFGNVLLVNGEPEVSIHARQGEVVRFYLANTANTRVFDVGIPGARMKLVGADSGRYEREVTVDSVLIAPSERVVVDVLFEKPGELGLEHRTPLRVYRLGTITVGTERAEPRLRAEFEQLRTNADLAAERERIAPYLDAEPDQTLALVAEMDMGAPELPPGAVMAYICPMHPDVRSEEPGRCPHCGMKLMAAERTAAAFACPMHPEVRSAGPDRCPKCGMKLVPAELVPEAPAASSFGETQSHAHAVDHDHAEPPREHAPDHAHAPGGIEWEDDMLEVNRMTNPSNTRWKLIDRRTGAEGPSIDWRFRVGDRVKIRLVNEMDSDHPMHHPFHIHGAGRFLILSRDGVVEPNLVWKDTVLVTTGQTVDILLDVTHPGVWMAHCHIAEHHESGMMLRFGVDPSIQGAADRNR